jgi:dATP pyrophosphohydrolase
VPGLAEGAPTALPRHPFKRPASVLVVPYTRDGEFLLLRRVQPDGFWQSVTGSLRPGEAPRAAALRELREETGLLGASWLCDMHQSRLFPILPAWRTRYAPGVCFNREYWFALALPGRRLIRLNPSEHREYLWIPAPRAARLATSWTNRDAIRWLSGAY